MPALSHPAATGRLVRAAIVGHGIEPMYLTISTSEIRERPSRVAQLVYRLARDAHRNQCERLRACPIPGLFSYDVYSAVSSRKYPPPPPFDRLIPSSYSWKLVSDAYQLPDWLLDEPLEDGEPPLLFVIERFVLADQTNATAAAKRGKLCLKALLPGGVGDLFTVQEASTEARKPVVSNETNERALLVPGTLILVPSEALEAVNDDSHVLSIPSPYSQRATFSLLALSQGGSHEAHPKPPQCFRHIVASRIDTTYTTLALDFHSFEHTIGWALDERKLKLRIGALLHQRCTRVLRGLQVDSIGGVWTESLDHGTPENILLQFASVSARLLATQPRIMIRIIVSGLDSFVHPVLDWLRASGDARALPLLERLRCALTAVLLKPLASIATGVHGSRFQVLLFLDSFETLRSWISDSGLGNMSPSTLARDLTGIRTCHIAAVATALGLAKSSSDADSLSTQLVQGLPVLSVDGDASTGSVDDSQSPFVDCYEMLDALLHPVNNPPKCYYGVPRACGWMSLALQQIGSFILHSPHLSDILAALDPLVSESGVLVLDDNDGHSPLESPTVRHILDEMQRHALVSPVLSRSPGAEPIARGYMASCPSASKDIGRMISEITCFHTTMFRPWQTWERLPTKPDLAFIHFVHARYGGMRPNFFPKSERVLQNDYALARRTATIRTGTAFAHWTLQEVHVVREDGSSGFIDLLEFSEDGLIARELKNLPIGDVVLATMKHLKLLDESVTRASQELWDQVPAFYERILATQAPDGSCQLAGRGPGSRGGIQPIPWPAIRYTRSMHDKPLKLRDGREIENQTTVTAQECLEGGVVQISEYMKPLQSPASARHAGFADPRLILVPDPNVRTPVRALVCMAIGGDALPVVQEVETFELDGYPVLVGVTPLEPDDRATLLRITKYFHGRVSLTKEVPPS